ncbi:MAG: adenylate kinase family protein [archaeon]
MLITVVTGTPGTGKTSFAKKMAITKTLKYVDVNKLISRYSLSDGYDEKRKCKIIDVKRLSLVIIELIKRFKLTKKSKYKGLIIDSHLSHYLPAHYVNVCYVTKCALPQLKERLEARGYNEEKVRENLDCEIFDICRVEALENGHNVKVIYTDKKIKR